MRCRKCSATFTWKDFENVLDEEWEEILGNIPCDRL
ncbi:MAG: dual CXXC motif small (seleno)protein [Thermodesulfobacteriota bacterium]